MVGHPREHEAGCNQDGNVSQADQGRRSSAWARAVREGLVGIAGRRGGQRGGHLELDQHGVVALPQVGQIQTPLIIFEPLGAGKGGSLASTDLCTRTPYRPGPGPCAAHQQVLHVPHGKVDVLQNFPAALGRPLHFLPFHRLFCGQKGRPAPG